MMRSFLTAAILCTFVSVAHAQFGPPSLTPMGKKIQSAVDSDIRTAAEKSRDENRRPRETLEFFRLQDDMRVIELVPSGGWYTKIIGPVLAAKGKFYVSLGTRRIGSVLKAHEELSKVEVLPDNGKFLPTEKFGLFDIGAFSIGIDDADLVLTFRNLHNFLPAGRANINKAAFAALKPGGLYGVVDHTRRHNEPETQENWRRMDPVVMIREAQLAGFELIDSSELHYRPDDELRYEVGRKTVSGNSDRFALLFRKPK